MYSQWATAVEGLYYCKRPIQCLASVDLPPPHRPASVVYPPLAFGAEGGHTRWVERGWGVNSSEDARHCSVLYLSKYFVATAFVYFTNKVHKYKHITHPSTVMLLHDTYCTCTYIEKCQSDSVFVLLLYKPT